MRSANANYKSARGLSEAVKRELWTSVEKGHAIAMSEAAALERFGEDLNLASPGALLLDNAGPQVVVRAVFHGTHCVPVSGSEIRTEHHRRPM